VNGEKFTPSEPLSRFYVKPGKLFMYLDHLRIFKEKPGMIALSLQPKKYLGLVLQKCNIQTNSFLKDLFNIFFS